VGFDDFFGNIEAKTGRPIFLIFFGLKYDNNKIYDFEFDKEIR